MGKVRLFSKATAMAIAAACLVSTGCLSDRPSSSDPMLNQGSGCASCAQARTANPQPPYSAYPIQRVNYEQPPSGDGPGGQPLDANSVLPPPRTNGPGGPLPGMGPGDPNGPFGGPAGPGGPFGSPGGPNCPNGNCPIGPNGPYVQPGYGPLPRELWPRSLPPYTVAPPDILFLDAMRMIPKGPYRIEPTEVLLISVTNTIPGQDIKGPYTVSPDGNVSLGFGYGNVHVGGLTLEAAAQAIREHLLNGILNRNLNPQVSVALAQYRTVQQVRGQHLVRPDGTISLGTYGSVYVAGLTLGQVKTVVEKHLANYVQDPQVAVDVFAYNSKVFYVIFDGAGYGQQVFRLPITGNETVLDAVSRVNGLAAVASKRRIWLARPAPANCGANQILPIDWNAITQSAATATNYQVLPGDRIYVDSNCLIRINNYLSQLLNPINQVMGTLFLGINTALGFQSLSAGTGFGGGIF